MCILKSTNAFTGLSPALWQRRYFELRGSKAPTLAFYGSVPESSRHRESQLGCYFLTQGSTVAPCAVGKESYKGCMLEIVSGRSGKLVLRAETPREMRGWLNALETSIARLRPTAEDLPQLRHDGVAAKSRVAV